MTTLSIGQAAKQAGVSVETIRFYESRGLIENPPRKRSGYRQYQSRDIARLQFILQAKALGFTLNEIQELLSLRADTESGCRELNILGQKKLDDIEKKIKSLQRIRGTLKNLLDQCPGEGPKSDCPILDALDPHEKVNT